MTRSNPAPLAASQPLRPLLGGWLLLVLITLGGLWLQEPPAPLPATAPMTAFSAERAMAHLRQIARAPHPMGTAEHDRVRDYLATAFRELGLTTRIQKRVAHRSGRRGDLLVATVENVIAERTGSDPTGVLLLTAHYDSHGSGPGAADDGAGVAALLETARALGQTRNTLRILITDAEEVGLLGAQAYIDEFPASSPTLVLNFEARGGGGPVYMFETSDHNRPLIRAFAAATPAPRASSLMYALYKTLPNDTDLTVYKKAGLSGLNFAFVGRWQHYHSMLDTPEGLDQRSLQQEGATALALSRTLLAADLATVTRTDQGDAIYFDLLGRTLVHYPTSWAWPLTLAALLAFGAVLWQARRGPRSWTAFLTGFGLTVGTLVAGALLGAGLGFLVQPFRLAIPNLDPYGVRWFEAALVFSALALLTLLWGWALRRCEGKALSLGALLVWLVALVAATALLPGATYLLLWPLLFALLGLAWDRPWVGALPLLLLFPPVWHSLALMLGFSLPLALGLLVAFGLVPLLPLLHQLAAPRLWLTPAVFLSLGLLCFAVGTRQQGPRVSSLAHVENADTGQAQWVSLQPPDAWTRAYLGDRPEATRLAGRSAHAAPAPPLHLPATTVTRLGQQLTLTLPERALALVLEAEQPLTGLLIEGKPVPLVRRIFWFAPPTGLTLTLEAPPGSHLSLEVVLPGLPSGTTPRPAGLIPAAAGPYSDTRIVRQKIAL